jgi:hypothetical protein
MPSTIRSSERRDGTLMEMVYFETDDGFWMDVFNNGKMRARIGPFDTEEGREKVYEGLYKAAVALGGFHCQSPHPTVN